MIIKTHTDHHPNRGWSAVKTWCRRRWGQYGETRKKIGREERERVLAQPSQERGVQGGVGNNGYHVQMEQEWDSRRVRSDFFGK